MKGKHECEVCEERFDRLNDKLIHFTKQHGDYIGLDSPKTLLRPISCWRCAKQCPAETLTCVCGWVHPSKTEGNQQ